MKHPVLWTPAMRRRLLTISALLSLLLCLGLAGAFCYTSAAHRSLSIASFDGPDQPGVWLATTSLMIQWLGAPLAATPTTDFAHWGMWGLAFIRIAIQDGQATRFEYGLAIPCWAILPPLLLLPALWLRAWRKDRRIARRLAKGLCLNCGYDLRQSKDRCPECGTPTAPSQEPGRRMV